MSFYEEYKKLKKIDFDKIVNNVSEKKIRETLEKDKLNFNDFLILLSNKALDYLELIAQKANKLNIQNFGKAVLVYTPLYISNYCVNECTYCGFNKKNNIKRKKLSLQEIEQEAIEISKSGAKHILLLTGEAKDVTPIKFLKQTIEILKKYFSSISIEIFPLDEKEYSELKIEGVDGLTVYQEVYDEKVYDEVHLSGKKKDYLYRLNAPERGAKAGLRVVNIGTLFGLADPIKEALFSAMHIKYLEKKYLGTEFQISMPRLNSAEGSIGSKFEVDDKKFVQILMAYRLFLPRTSINISTRENSYFRENLLNLGVTKFSAGSKTEVGGYSRKEDDSVPQFSISDERSFEETINRLKELGFQPVYKDWELL